MSIENNMYIKVVDDAIVGEPVFHGKPTAHHSWCKGSTVEEYAEAGYYLIIASKPEITGYQVMERTGFTLDHELKTVTGVWTVTDRTPEEIAEMQEREFQKQEINAGILADKSLSEINDWIDGITTLAQVKQALKAVARYSKSIGRQ